MRSNGEILNVGISKIAHGAIVYSQCRDTPGTVLVPDQGCASMLVQFGGSAHTFWWVDNRWQGLNGEELVWQKHKRPEAEKDE